jgi:hypothetical protein
LQAGVALADAALPCANVGRDRLPCATRARVVAILNAVKRYVPRMAFAADSGLRYLQLMQQLHTVQWPD